MTETVILPISTVIPTRNRSRVLWKTLESFGIQGHQPAEIIIIDGSESTETQLMLGESINRLQSKIIYLRAEKLGAAIQRNQGVEKSRQPFILFADDDVYLEENCIARLWRAMEHYPDLGAVNAMVTNQKYLPMGRFSTFVASVLNGGRLDSFAGKCLTPGWGLLPEDRADLGEFVPVEWLNLGATLYRKEALPSPVFSGHFTGYSLMEDLALSIGVGRKWKLFNARTARIYHDSQPGSHKKSTYRLGEMEIINRHYIMTRVLNRSGIRDYFKLFFFESFQLISNLTSLRGIMSLPVATAGRISGMLKIMLSSKV